MIMSEERMDPRTDPRNKDEVRYARNFHYKIVAGPFVLTGDCLKPEDTANTAVNALKELFRKLGMIPDEIDSAIEEIKRGKCDWLVKLYEKTDANPYE